MPVAPEPGPGRPHYIRSPWICYRKAQEARSEPQAWNRGFDTPVANFLVPSLPPLSHRIDYSIRHPGYDRICYAPESHRAGFLQLKRVTATRAGQSHWHEHCRTYLRSFKGYAVGGGTGALPSTARLREATDEVKQELKGMRQRGLRHPLRCFLVLASTTSLPHSLVLTITSGLVGCFLVDFARLSVVLLRPFTFAFGLRSYSFDRFL